MTKENVFLQYFEKIIEKKEFIFCFNIFHYYYFLEKFFDKDLVYEISFNNIQFLLNTEDKKNKIMRNFFSTTYVFIFQINQKDIDQLSFFKYYIKYQNKNMIFLDSTKINPMDVYIINVRTENMRKIRLEKEKIQLEKEEILREEKTLEKEENQLKKEKIQLKKKEILEKEKNILENENKTFQDEKSYFLKKDILGKTQNDSPTSIDLKKKLQTLENLIIFICFFFLELDFYIQNKKYKKWKKEDEKYIIPGKVFEKIEKKTNIFKEIFKEKTFQDEIKNLLEKYQSKNQKKEKEKTSKSFFEEKNYHENMIEKKEFILSQENIDKIIDIFKDIYLFRSFQYFDLTTEEEKNYAKKYIKIKPTYNNFFYFKEIINDKKNYTNILINNLNTIYSLQKKDIPKTNVEKFCCLFFNLESETIKFQKKICIYGLAKKNLDLESEAYQRLGKLEDQTFFILSFVFCMLNVGTKNKDTESFTLEHFKKEIERIEEILNELINSQKIEELKKAIEEGKNIKDKETLKDILEPFFQKNIKKGIEKKEDFIETKNSKEKIRKISNKNNEDLKTEEDLEKEKQNKNQKSKLKFYLGILFFILISILILFYKKYFKFINLFSSKIKL